jgi:integrase
VRFVDAIDRYIADMRAQGRINSTSSERGYRATLMAHAEDVANRDPGYVGREDVKRTLRRWVHPNTQSTNRSKLVSFYRWAMEEGLRNDNPVEQTRRPRRRPTDGYRLTESESVAMLLAADGVRERRAIFLLICVGLRNAELRGLKGKHLARRDWVWVSEDIAKGRRTSRRAGANAGFRSSPTWRPSSPRSWLMSRRMIMCCRRSGSGIRRSTG